MLRNENFLHHKGSEVTFKESHFNQCKTNIPIKVRLHDAIFFPIINGLAQVSRLEYSSFSIDFQLVKPIHYYYCTGKSH